MTIRKVIKECVDKGLFDSILNIGRYPLLDHVPPEVAVHYRPLAKKGHQTIRYSPA